MAKFFEFTCGCRWPIIGDPPSPDALPLMEVDDDNLPDCPAVWEMLGRGCTKGVFQLESSLGRQWAKRLKPESAEHLGALGAILRPGCIGGDSAVFTTWTPRPYRPTHGKKVAIRNLYKKFLRQHCQFKNTVVSVDEQTNLFFNNELLDVTYSGDKEVFFVNIKTGYRNDRENRIDYNLECTLDHKLLTSHRGWVELQNLYIGERIAVYNNRKKIRRSDRSLVYAEGEKYFRDTCWLRYENKCVLCDWNDGSLDVNHLRGNRKYDNSHTNLCFLCPNHHRVFTEGGIKVEKLESVRSKYTLPHTNHIMWAEFAGYTFAGKKDTYDISVAGPNHNFIAGNFLVHNCLRVEVVPGVSMTEQYCRRKNNEEEAEVYCEPLRPILEDTYQCILYQEQLIRMGKELAGFDLVQADKLRKSVGKKDVQELAKVRKMFIEGCQKVGVVTDEQANTIWGWIEKSGRYLFNKSHSMSYGLLGYDTAYMKAHFPVQFFANWLMYAAYKADPREENAELVEDARLLDVPVDPPDMRDLDAAYLDTSSEEVGRWYDRNGKLIAAGPQGEQVSDDVFAFCTDGVRVRFGFKNVKGLGRSHVVKLFHAYRAAREKLGRPLAEWGWGEFLFHCAPGVPASVLHPLVAVGAFRWTGKTRARLANELAAWDSLTPPEQTWVANNCDPADGLMSALRAVAQPRKEPEWPRVLKKDTPESRDRLAALEKEYAELLLADDADAVRANRKAYKALTKPGARPDDTPPFVPGGCATEARRQAVLSRLALLERPPASEADTPNFVAAEEEKYLGVALTCNRVDACDTAEANCTCKEFLAGRTGRLTLAVEVRESRVVKTKRGKNPGQKMAFLTVADSSCSMGDVTVFPDAWQQFGHLLRAGNTVLLTGERDAQRGSFIANGASQI